MLRQGGIKRGGSAPRPAADRELQAHKNKAQGAALSRRAAAAAGHAQQRNPAARVDDASGEPCSTKRPVDRNRYDPPHPDQPR